MTWEDVPGWFDFAAYYDSVVENYRDGVLVEVGCYLGRSLCYLGQKVRESGKDFRVVGVDWCLGSGEENGIDHHADALRRGGGTFAGELWGNVVACGLQDVVSLAVGESGRVADLFPDNSLTAVFLDERHDHVSVAWGVETWLPKVKLGGELAGDDFGLPDQPDHERVWPGVKRAVSELLPGYECVPHDAWKYRKR